MNSVKPNITKVLKQVIKHDNTSSGKDTNPPSLRILIPITKNSKQVSYLRRLFTKCKTEKCKCSQIDTNVKIYQCGESDQLFLKPQSNPQSKSKQILKTNTYTSNLYIENLNIVVEMYILQIYTKSPKTPPQKFNQTTCYKIFSQT